jgi:hypothetical protein
MLYLRPLGLDCGLLLTPAIVFMAGQGDKCWSCRAESGLIPHAKIAVHPEYQKLEIADRE